MRLAHIRRLFPSSEEPMIWPSFNEWQKKRLFNGSDLRTRLILSPDIAAHFLHEPTVTQDREAAG